MEILLSTGIFETAQLPSFFADLSKADFRKLEVVDKGEFTEEILESAVFASKEHGIEIPNWHLIQRSPFQPTAIESRAAIDRMKLSMDQGRRLGANNHVVHWDNRYIGGENDDVWRTIVDEWVAHAEALGVRLLMETVPDKPTNQRYVPCGEILAFVEKYPPESLSVCLDVNHSNLKEKLPDVVRILQDRLVSIHLSDNDGHSERHWLPGLGVIDYKSLFVTLEAVAFAGKIVLELNRWCDEPESLSNLKLLNRLAKSLIENKTPHAMTFNTEYVKYAV